MSFGDIILVILLITVLYGLYRFFFAAWRFRTFFIIFSSVILALGGTGWFIWWQIQQMKEKPYYESEWNDGQAYDLNGNPIKMNSDDAEQ
jgi:hypothetical protein